MLLLGMDVLSLVCDHMDAQTAYALVKTSRTCKTVALKAFYRDVQLTCPNDTNVDCHGCWNKKVAMLLDTLSCSPLRTAKHVRFMTLELVMSTTLYFSRCEQHWWLPGVTWSELVTALRQCQSLKALDLSTFSDYDRLDTFNPGPNDIVAAQSLTWSYDGGLSLKSASLFLSCFNALKAVSITQANSCSLLVAKHDGVRCRPVIAEGGTLTACMSASEFAHWCWVAPARLETLRLLGRLTDYYIFPPMPWNTLPFPSLLWTAPLPQCNRVYLGFYQAKSDYKALQVGNTTIYTFGAAYADLICNMIHVAVRNAPKTMVQIMGFHLNDVTPHAQELLEAYFRSKLTDMDFTTVDWVSNATASDGWRPPRSFPWVHPMGQRR